jgi:hypothetical protein
LADFELIVVVCHIPTAFINSELAGIEKIITLFNIPTILYQNYYLATRGNWYKNIINPANYLVAGALTGMTGIWQLQ